MSRRIHEREHIDTYDTTSKTPTRGRPRSDPSKDFTYRIVRRRDSDEEVEEYEDITGGGSTRPKRRYRKKKDAERVQQAFSPVLPQQGTTVVKLTRSPAVSQPQTSDSQTNPVYAVNLKGVHFQVVKNS